jgi:hypothetical protein
MTTTDDLEICLEAPLVPGDVVRVKKPDVFLVAFAAKIANRDAVVQWVGPTANGMFKGRAKVKFLKRNGRGKEFEEVLWIDDFIRVSRATKATGAAA